MNESAWIQSNWYELGNLLNQFAFLSAGIWFARKILRTMRASQEQVGALLKLSVTGSRAGTTPRPLGVDAPFPLLPPPPWGAKKFFPACPDRVGSHEAAGHRNWPAALPRKMSGRKSVKARHKSHIERSKIVCGSNGE